MGGLKMIFLKLKLTFLLDWATWRAGLKRQKSIYEEPPTLGIPKQRVVLNNGAADRLKYREVCLAINSRLFIPFAFFPFAFFLLVLYPQSFAYLRS